MRPARRDSSSIELSIYPRPFENHHQSPIAQERKRQKKERKERKTLGINHKSALGILCPLSLSRFLSSFWAQESGSPLSFSLSPGNTNSKKQIGHPSVPVLTRYSFRYSFLENATTYNIPCLQLPGAKQKKGPQTSVSYHIISYHSARCVALRCFGLDICPSRSRLRLVYSLHSPHSH